MQILAALYAGTSSEKATLAEWVEEKEDKEGDSWRWIHQRNLVVFIWPRISKEKLDEQIIAEAFGAARISLDKTEAALKVAAGPRRLGHGETEEAYGWQ
jgi:hypothetical protein